MRQPRWAAVVVTAVGVALGSPGVAQTALDERQQHVATIVTGEIEKLTGPGSRNCGIFTLRAVDGASPVDRGDVAAALRCVRAAQRRGQAAWAIWQVPRVDAILFDGIGASAVSAVHTVTGRGTNADVELAPCLAPHVNKAAEIECANRRPRSTRDIGKALKGLKRDVERTSGLSWADVAPASPVEPAAGPDALAAQATTVQRHVHASGATAWPRCPHHFDHPLTYRDGWWFCERDHAYIAAVGRVSSAVPWVKRRR